MKANKIIYWTSTGLLAAGFAMSSFMYLTHNPELVKGFETLGYPMYLLYILGAAKLLAVIGILQQLSSRARQWAYAGITFTLAGAFFSHIATSTPFIAPLVFLVLMMVSWIYNDRVHKESHIAGI